MPSAIPDHSAIWAASSQISASFRASSSSKNRRPASGTKIRVTPAWLRTGILSILEYPLSEVPVAVSVSNMMPCTALAPLLAAADADAAHDAHAQVVGSLVQLVGAELLALLGPHNLLLSGVELQDDLLYAVGVHALLHI